MNPEQHVYKDDLFAEYDYSDTGKNFPVFHCHNVYEIYLLEHGERNIVIDDRMYRTEGGDAAMIRSFELHRSFGDTPYSGICINFSGKYLEKYFSDTAREYLLSCFAQPIIRLSPDESGTIHRLAERIMEKKENKFIWLADILNIFIGVAEKCGNSRTSIDVPALNPVMDYIADNLTSITGLDDIASALHLNKNYLCGLFKRKTGMTVSSYVNMLRIQQACALLADETKTVDEVGAECGYASSSYFCRTFKKLLGCTPGDFRKRTL